jgi:hypothetical protein
VIDFIHPVGSPEKMESDNLNKGNKPEKNIK